MCRTETGVGKRGSGEGDRAERMEGKVKIRKRRDE